MPTRATPRITSRASGRCHRPIAWVRKTKTSTPRSARATASRSSSKSRNSRNGDGLVGKTGCGRFADISFGAAANDATFAACVIASVNDALPHFLETRGHVHCGGSALFQLRASEMRAAHGNRVEALLHFLSEEAAAAAIDVRVALARLAGDVE